MAGLRARLRAVADAAAPAALLLSGAMTAVGFFALMTIGYPYFFGGIAIGVLALACGFPARLAFGYFLTGSACEPAYLAWLNHDGPGNVCEATDHGQRCIEQWSPWPFAVVAIALVVVGRRLIGPGRHPRVSAAGVPGEPVAGATPAHH